MRVECCWLIRIYFSSAIGTGASVLAIFLKVVRMRGLEAHILELDKEPIKTNNMASASISCKSNN